MNAKQLQADRTVLRTIINDSSNGASTILGGEIEALVRIHAFLAGPSARDIDAIVDVCSVEQHDAEKVVRAIFGERK